ncbi:MAG: class I SAM-dependent methyltransferase [Pseudobdellovibrio sp.]
MPLMNIPFWHYGMLRDTERTQFYEDIIKKNCAGKVILEIGSGSGLLSALALQHGAKHVYAVEENTQLAESSLKLIKRLNLENRFTLFNKNSTKLELNELPKVDIILHEIFGSDPFAENVILTLTDAKRFLKPDGILLPESIYLTFRTLKTKEVAPLIYNNIELTEALDLFSNHYPNITIDSDANENNTLFITQEIRLSELIDNKNFAATITSDQLTKANLLEVAFIIKHNDDSILSYEIGSKKQPKHWSSFLLVRKSQGTPEVTFTLGNTNRLVCI